MRWSTSDALWVWWGFHGDRGSITPGDHIGVCGGEGDLISDNVLCVCVDGWVGDGGAGGV